MQNDIDKTINNPIIINFFGEPGAGKSCASAYVFYSLKKLGYNIEYLQEFAKQKLYENANKVFSCEPYIFGKQLYRLKSIGDNVDIVVTDSPLLLPHFYEQDENFKKLLLQLELNCFNSFNNINYFIVRNHTYQQNGRFQTEDEALQINNEILNFLSSNSIDFQSILSSDVNEKFISNLIKIIDERMNEYEL